VAGVGWVRALVLATPLIMITVQLRWTFFCDIGDVYRSSDLLISLLKQNGDEYLTPLAGGEVLTRSVCVCEVVHHAYIASHLRHPCGHHCRLLRANRQRHLASVIINNDSFRRWTHQQTSSQSYQDLLVHMEYENSAIIHCVSKLTHSAIVNTVST